MSLTRHITHTLIGAAMGLCAPATLAQEFVPSKVEIAWNRYHDYAQIERQLKDIAQAYPDLVTLVPLGETLQGRTVWVAIVNNQATGPDTSKPGMWIDGNVHGNEVQAGEAVVYSLWALTKEFGHNDDLTELLNTTSFYFCPSQNPDGRDYWFHAPNTPHSSRHNQRPVDNDLDGLVDEDPPDDLDGDGQITMMWMRDPDGRWIRDPFDDRIFTRVKPDQRGEWTLLGQEGLDNDHDGRVNEDGPFADDMNRNWPGDWQPSFVQYGAGPYPLSAPETRGIAEFIRSHPNIAAVQSYHNSGGMILRGPGAAYREGMYPRADQRVYDEIARAGEQMLPYYRSMVIYKDLYGVHGGFVNWTAESLGIVSFTNEMWSSSKFFQRDGARPTTDQQWLWRDHMVFGKVFKDYSEYEHPIYGTVLIGGPNKWSSRTTPTFMLEEECHRNFAFTMFHARQMPRVVFERVQTERLGEGLWSVTVEIRNEHLIPTRTGVAMANRIGEPDLLICEPSKGTVVLAGRLGGWFEPQIQPIIHEPGRVLMPEGVGSRRGRIIRFLVNASTGGTVTLRFHSDKARDIERVVELKDDSDN